MRTASGRLLLDGTKPLSAVSPDKVATMLSTNMLLGEERISSVTLMPATGLISKAPEKASNRVSIWLVAMSSRLIAVRFKVRMVGVLRCPAPDA